MTTTEHRAENAARMVAYYWSEKCPANIPFTLTVAETVQLLPLPGCRWGRLQLDLGTHYEFSADAIAERPMVATAPDRALVCVQVLTGRAISAAVFLHPEDA